VSIKELAEYLGHKDPAFTLRVYAHMLPTSHERARAVISERFSRVAAKFLQFLQVAPLLEELASYHHALDLVGALVDLGDVCHAPR
jgi:hypothetical protein